jgi:hypothetical protein
MHRCSNFFQIRVNCLARSYGAPKQERIYPEDHGYFAEGGVRIIYVISQEGNRRRPGFAGRGVGGKLALGCLLSGKGPPNRPFPASVEGEAARESVLSVKPVHVQINKQVMLKSVLRHTPAGLRQRTQFAVICFNRF